MKIQTAAVVKFALLACCLVASFNLAQAASARAGIQETVDITLPDGGSTSDLSEELSDLLEEEANQINDGVENGFISAEEISRNTLKCDIVCPEGVSCPCAGRADVDADANAQADVDPQGALDEILAYLDKVAKTLLGPEGTVEKLAEKILGRNGTAKQLVKILVEAKGVVKEIEFELRRINQEIDIVVSSILQRGSKLEDLVIFLLGPDDLVKSLGLTLLGPEGIVTGLIYGL